jgi:hypothetical protein
MQNGEPRSGPNAHLANIRPYWAKTATELADLRRAAQSPAMATAMAEAIGTVEEMAKPVATVTLVATVTPVATVTATGLRMEMPQAAMSAEMQILTRTITALSPARLGPSMPRTLRQPLLPMHRQILASVR